MVADVFVSHATEAPSGRRSSAAGPWGGVRSCRRSRRPSGTCVSCSSSVVARRAGMLSLRWRRGMLSAQADKYTDKCSIRPAGSAGSARPRRIRRSRSLSCGEVPTTCKGDGGEDRYNERSVEVVATRGENRTLYAGS